MSEINNKLLFTKTITLPVLDYMFNFYFLHFLFNSLLGIIRNILAVLKFHNYSSKSG